MRGIWGANDDVRLFRVFVVSNVERIWVLQLLFMVRFETLSLLSSFCFLEIDKADFFAARDFSAVEL